MDFIVGTSRAHPVVEHFWYEEGIPGESYGGYKIPKLVEKGLEMLRVTGFIRRSDNILYIMGGMPDVTVKLHRGFRYQEVVHQANQGDPQSLVDHVMTHIREGAAAIAAVGTTPVFTTVCPMDFSIWNNFRLFHGKTKSLEHIQEYPYMQELHQTTIEILNREIENLNSENGMVTPKVMKTAFQKKGFGLPYRLRLGRLQEDGCHLTPETTGDVIRVLRDIMSVNRINLYDQPNYAQSYISLDELSDNSSDNIGSDLKIESSSSDSGASGGSNESAELTELIRVETMAIIEAHSKEKSARLEAEFFRKNPHLFIKY